ncbi:MAG: class I SAM-dependent methyltransferase [Thermomicrobiales bacterium]
MSLETFVLRYLPPAPARVLEIGCGPAGDLTYAVAKAGYDVVAVDPVAPEGPLFCRIPFEDFAEPGPFDAVVASLSVHHIADLARTATAIAGLLAPGGRLIVEEWDRERFLDDATARWYFHQRQAVVATGRHTGHAPMPARYEDWLQSWIGDHGDLHGYAAMRSQLMSPFRERFFTWRPYLYRYGLHPQLEPLERSLIEEGAIQATGFRWVGEVDSETHAIA